MIGRDHLDTGSVASPFRETEGMKDGSDAIADWAILNAMLNVASGASWVSFHHGGGVGIGNSLHAGQVIVADGTPEMRVRLERVLTNDPGIGVARHADAGYDSALATADREGIRIPMRELMKARGQKPESRSNGALAQQSASGFWTLHSDLDAVFPLQTLARPALPGEIRLARRDAAAGARPLRGHHALQRAVWLLRLLEDAGSPIARTRPSGAPRRRGSSTRCS